MKGRSIYDQDEHSNVKTGQRLVVSDDKGPGGAHHIYMVVRCKDDGAVTHTDAYIELQKGPVGEVGVNGIHNEHLLAIVKDRLECFQEGSFACPENQGALEAVNRAMDFLHSRTADRSRRGVEGKNEQ